MCVCVCLCVRVRVYLAGNERQSNSAGCLLHTQCVRGRVGERDRGIEREAEGERGREKGGRGQVFQYPCEV